MKEFLKTKILKAQKQIRHQAGFSIVETMVAVGILAVVGVASFTQVGNMRQIQNFSQVQTTRDQVGESIHGLVASPATVYFSATDRVTNPELANCVLGTRGLNACQAGQSFPVVLQLPTNAAVRVPLTGRLSAAGLFTTGAMYNQRTGDVCIGATTASVDCRIAVAASFRAKCPNRGAADNAQATCRQAESIEITYVVQDELQGRQNAAGNGTSGGRAGEISVRQIRHSFVLPTLMISLYKPQNRLPASDPSPVGCVDGEIAVGLNGVGNLVCQKLDYSCPVGMTTVGLDRFGRPISVPGTTVENANGRFNNYNGVVQIVCVNQSCSNSLATSLAGSNLSTLAPECFTSSAIQCDTEGAESNATAPKVLVDIQANQNAVCHQLTQSCYQQDNDGASLGERNFTAGFNAYNAPIGAGVVDSRCEQWGCPVYSYMTGFTARGNCQSVPPTPPSCPAGPVSWTVGGYTCTAPRASTAGNTSVVATDAEATVTAGQGSATFSCSGSGAWGGPSAATCEPICTLPNSSRTGMGASTPQPGCRCTAVGMTWNGSACVTPPALVYGGRYCSDTGYTPGTECSTTTPGCVDGATCTGECVSDIQIVGGRCAIFSLQCAPAGTHAAIAPIDPALCGPPTPPAPALCYEHEVYCRPPAGACESTGTYTTTAQTTVTIARNLMCGSVNSYCSAQTTLNIAKYTATECGASPTPPPTPVPCTPTPGVWVDIGSGGPMGSPSCGSNVLGGTCPNTNTACGGTMCRPSSGSLNWQCTTAPTPPSCDAPNIFAGALYSALGTCNTNAQSTCMAATGNQLGASCSAQSAGVYRACCAPAFTQCWQGTDATQQFPDQFSCESHIVSGNPNGTCSVVACAMCPAGTSSGGQGGVAAPSTCRCDNAGETWSAGMCTAPVSYCHRVLHPQGLGDIPMACRGTSAQCANYVAAAVSLSSCSPNGPSTWVCDGDSDGWNEVSASWGTSVPPGFTAGSIPNCP